MIALIDILTGGFVRKTVDAVFEGLYEGLFDKHDPVDELDAGDIIGIERLGGVYEHYAVYIGSRRVIHYAAENGDFGGATVHEAPIEDFLDGQSTFFVLEFDEAGKRPNKQEKGYRSSPIYRKNRFNTGPYLIPVKDKFRNDDDILYIYSPEETVARAKSLIGEDQYNLITNNCEHFAIWCKTGAHKSYQVERVLGYSAHRPLMLM